MGERRAARSQGTRRRRGAGRLVLCAAVLGACGSSAGALPARPQVAEVVMREYRFENVPASLRPGRLVFEVRNLGRVSHEAVLVYLDPKIPPLARQLRAGRRLVVPTVARLFAREPKGRGTFAVDLEPGRYGLICFVTDPDGRQHSVKGMSSEFRVK